MTSIMHVLLRSMTSLKTNFLVIHVILKDMYSKKSKFTHKTCTPLKPFSDHSPLKVGLASNAAEGRNCMLVLMIIYVIMEFILFVRLFVCLFGPQLFPQFSTNPDKILRAGQEYTGLKINLPFSDPGSNYYYFLNQCRCTA